MTTLPADELGGLPRHNLDLEMGVLGSAMLSPDGAGVVTEMLTREDFLRAAHQLIFDVISTLVDRGERPDVMAVRIELGNHPDAMARIPDPLYLHTLLEHTPAGESAAHWAGKLRLATALRRTALVGPQIGAMALEASLESAEQVIENAHKLLDEATQTRDSSKAMSVADRITPFIERLESGGDLRGVTTGWMDLDSLLVRLRPGQLITIGARPGMGKTSAMIGIAHHVGVKLGLPVFASTLEMSGDEFMDRLVALDARVELRHLLEPALLTEGDWDRLSASHARLSEARTFVIDDQPGSGIAHIRGALRSMRRRGQPAALAIIDYLQLMEGGGKSESRQLEVSQMSRSLKLLAKEFQLPIVIGSQLNRGVEHRADKRPTIADIRESGAVEQDSDVVILLYRDEVYDQESPRAGEMDFIVDKNRNGPRTTITMAFQGRYSRVVDMAAEPWSPTRGL